MGIPLSCYCKSCACNLLQIFETLKTFIFNLKFVSGFITNNSTRSQSLISSVFSPKVEIFTLSVFIVLRLSLFVILLLTYDRCEAVSKIILAKTFGQSMSPVFETLVTAVCKNTWVVPKPELTWAVYLYGISVGIFCFSWCFSSPFV